MTNPNAHVIPESELLSRMVDEEMDRPVTARELKQFETFNGIPPHRRPGPRMATYPWMTVRELIGMRALLVYLLVREYRLSITDTKLVLRAPDEATVEKLLVLGDEIGPKASFVAAAKVAVRNAAEIILDAQPLPTGKERVVRLLEPKSQVGASRLTRAEVKLVMCFLIYLLMRGFGFKKPDVRAMLWYPSAQQLVTMMFMGERMVESVSLRRIERGRVLPAARVIVGRGC